MYRFMIADSDEVFLSVVQQIFSAEFEIVTCQDGETALELLNEFQPQVLIINLLLPFKDGLTVLREAATVPPVTIATTTILSSHIEAACQELQVGYLMISPSLNALRVQVTAMVNHWENNHTKPNLQTQTLELLHMLNFATQRIGSRQLCVLLPLYYQDREQCLDAALYAAVGKQFSRTASAVERAIRAVIQDAWKTRDKIVWRKYFPNQTECPSNKAFFDALADHLCE